MQWRAPDDRLCDGSKSKPTLQESATELLCNTLVFYKKIIIMEMCWGQVKRLLPSNGEADCSLGHCKLQGNISHVVHRAVATAISNPAEHVKRMCFEFELGMHDAQTYAVGSH